MFSLLLLLMRWRGDSAAASSRQPAANAAMARHGWIRAPAPDPAQAFSARAGGARPRTDWTRRNAIFARCCNSIPKPEAAYANLGVVYMRRKQWTQALEVLQKAEQLMPQVAGIRLNIGLAYYRQNEFLKAMPPFESVVRDQPDALQPRYLLGLCYFFAERWADAATTLEPLWPQESGQLPYLYVLSNAAHRAGRKELDNRATATTHQIGRRFT